MISFPNAKINLGLRVLEKLENGFHLIESILLPIKINDIVEIININQKFNYKNTGITIKEDKSNLCIKAYNLLKKDYNLPDLQIYLHKIIPVGAGLGGGSSDAVAVIKLLDKMFNLSISENKIKYYCNILGSDCLFFYYNKIAYIRGKGEILKFLNLSISPFYISIVYPNIFISTKEAYANIKAQKRQDTLINYISQHKKNWKNLFVNDFENYAFKKFPLLKNIKNFMYEKGAFFASMTGTGSAIYGFFDQKPNLNHFFKKYFYKEIYFSI